VALQDFKYKDQLFDALASAESNVAEGFHRDNTGEIIRFLTFARGSAAEAKTRLLDGVERGYFPATAVKEAISFGNRSLGAIAAWQRSLEPFRKRRPCRKKRSHSNNS
jgi:four helix bundle protein